MAILRRIANRLMAFLIPLLPRCAARPSALISFAGKGHNYVAGLRLAKIRASGLGCAGPIRRNVFRSV
jgi:hypothetical protein